MLVLGGNVNGGQVHGSWPGLHTDQLYDKRDVAITTDYRRVLSEILIRRMGNPHLGYIFPGYADHQPMNLVTGADLTPIYTPTNPDETPTPTPTPPPNSTPTPTFTPTATLRPGETAPPTASPTPPGAPEDNVYLPLVQN
jgi:hypothetical protein